MKRLILAMPACVAVNSLFAGDAAIASATLRDFPDIKGAAGPVQVAFNGVTCSIDGF